ncbi:MAG: hypothetical protein HPY73_05690 [Methanomassiliicoccales archaeon]|nr:MAG: hypothetical protein HPY73_05690 [Methanomassiliicoccales archaeon]
MLTWNFQSVAEVTALPPSFRSHTWSAATTSAEAGAARQRAMATTDIIIVM